VTLLVLASAAVVAFPPAAPRPAEPATDPGRIILGGRADLLRLAGAGPAGTNSSTG